MPHVEQAVPYEIRVKYPHLRPRDVEIWQHFIQKNPDRFNRVFYDYRVGDPEDWPEDAPRYIALAWKDLTMWQIDVTAEDDDFLYIIELKPFARSTAIGQALAYKILFDREEKPWKPTIPVVITDTILKSTKYVADKLGVQIWTP